MKFTTNILAFYLLLGSCLPRTDFSQLLRLKDLQEHYQLHQLEARLAGENFTLQAFLYDHFIQPDGHEHENNNEQHNNLPMQACSVSVLMVFAKTSLPDEVFENDKTIVAHSFKNQFYPSVFLSVIEQPPC